MIKCPNCNHDVSDENIFCPECGTRLSAPAPVQEPQTPVVEAAPEQVAAPEQAAAPEQVAEQPEKAEKKGGLKNLWGKVKAVANKVLDKIPLPKKVVAIIGAAVVALLVLIIILVIALSGGKKEDYPHALYIKDGDLYYSNLKKGKEKEILDINSELGSNLANRSGRAATLNEAGTRLFYPEFTAEGSTLYYRDLKKKEGVKVDSNVSVYAINDKGNSIVYLKEGSLYKSNLKDKDKIASDVSEFAVSKDLKKIVYIKENAIYFKNGNKDAVKLAAEASLRAYDKEDLAWVFYSKEGSLYFQKTKKDDKIKVAEDYSSFITALEDGTAYFVKSEITKINLWNCVEDDMAASDAAMVEPIAPTWPIRESYPAYPWYSDFETNEEYQEAMQQYNAECDRIDREYNDAVDKYYEDQTAYYAARDLWYAKENRDSLREELKQTEHEQMTYELYYFDGKEAKLVLGGMTGYYNVSIMDDVNAGLASFYASGEIGKVKMSEVNYIWEVTNALNQSTGTQTYKLIREGKSFDLELEDVKYVRMSEDAKKIWLLADVDSEKNTGDLYEAKFNKKGMGKAKKIDSDVATVGFAYVEDAGIVYMKEYKDGKGDLYVDGKKIDFDAQGGIIAFKGGYLYQTGEELKYYKNGKKFTVAEKVQNAALYNDDTLVLLYDYNSEKGRGTLGVFTGKKKLNVLDDDVSGLIVPSTGTLHYIYN